mmetsp:Transcript_47416/g.124280  ORF Transcript_47416/g.124280 Transcript_47416/m.124280 type:complete len:277 (-) Transcript_47416:619-1449(-)
MHAARIISAGEMASATYDMTRTASAASMLASIIRRLDSRMSIAVAAIDRSPSGAAKRRSGAAASTSRSRCRQTGHRPSLSSHSSMHGLWNRWPQTSSEHCSSPAAISFRQIMHSVCASWSSMVGGSAPKQPAPRSSAAGSAARSISELLPAVEAACADAVDCMEGSELPSPRGVASLPMDRGASPTACWICSVGTGGRPSVIGDADPGGGRGVASCRPDTPRAPIRESDGMKKSVKVLSQDGTVCPPCSAPSSSVSLRGAKGIQWRSTPRKLPDRH